MPNGNSMKRKLTRKFINKRGFEVTFFRYQKNAPKDRHGEPIDDNWPRDTYTGLIVIDTEKLDNYQSMIGGLTEDKKEILFFLCAGDLDVRVGDKMIYPGDTDNQWLINHIEPQVFEDVVVLQEIKAMRDDRT
jgi:hypothetical protein